MKAVAYSKFGPSGDVLSLMDLPTPTPGPGEVRVKVAFSGVNPSDVKARAGSRPGVTRPPFDQVIPHSDGSGTIDAVGDGVPQDRIGERVWLWNGQWQRPFGTAADYIVLPAAQAVRLPDAASLEAGAVMGIPGLNAAHTVFNGGDIAGQTILVQGAAGSVGYLAVQFAKWGGATVIATARGAGLEKARAAGADAVIDFSEAAVADRILAANGGRPVDQIVELELGHNFEVDAAAIKENGRICAYGSQINMAPTMPFGPLLFKAVTIDIALIYILTDAERSNAVERVNAILSEGRLDVPISAPLALADCAAAHDLVASGQRDGAVLLRP